MIRGIGERQYIERVRVLFDFYLKRDFIVEEVWKDFCTEGDSTDTFPKILFKISEKEHTPCAYVIISHEKYFRFFCRNRNTGKTQHSDSGKLFQMIHDGSIDRVILEDPLVLGSTLVKKAILEEIFTNVIGTHVYLIEEEFFTDDERVIFRNEILPSIYREYPYIHNRRVGINNRWYMVKGDFVTTPEGVTDNWDPDSYELVADSKLIEAIRGIRQRRIQYV